MDDNKGSSEQEQKQERNKGPVDYINDLRNTFRMGKMLKGLGGAGHAPEGSGKELQAAGQVAKLAMNIPHVRMVVIGIGIVIVLIIIIFFFFGGGGGGSGLNIGISDPGSGIGNFPRGDGTGPGTNQGSLNYYIPFRDPTINPEDLRNVILSSWPNAQIGNWDLIINAARENGWNPAFILTLWVEESGAQGVASYTDALGCDPSNPTTDINKSLNCVFKSFSGLTNDQFEDFMCRYGGDNFSDAPCTFNNHNPNFPINIRAWYEKFVPGGPGVLVDVPPTQPPTLTGSCPVQNYTPISLTCGSYFTLQSGCGHCRADAGYGPYMGHCTYDAINYAQDVAGSPGTPVYLPTINDEQIVWTRERITSSSVGYIRYYSGVAETSGNRYWIQFHHVDRDVGTAEGVSGDIGAQICTSGSECNHVHIEFSIMSGGGMIPQDAPLFLCT